MPKAPPADGLWVERLRIGDEPYLPPIVLLHGFTGDVTTWLPVLARLETPNPIWAVDLPGHGRSPALDGTPVTMSDAVEAVISAMWGPPQPAPQPSMAAHWVGYSMGGRVALHLARSHPEAVASLTVAGASPGLANEAERRERMARDEALADSLLADGMARFVDRWLDLPLFAGLRNQARSVWGRSVLDRARRQRLRNRPEDLAAVLRGMGTGAMPQLWDGLSEIRCPVLVLAGEADEKFTEIGRRLALGLPSARFESLPSAGHALLTEAPGEMAARIARFVTDRA